MEPRETETSETQAPVQEQVGGEQPSTDETPTQSPQAGAVEQEQLETQPADDVAAEQLSPEVLEQIRQQLWPEHQSRADRQVAQRIRDYEEKQTQEAEAKRLQALPGDQFKQATLQRQALERVQQDAVAQAGDRISKMYGDVTTDVLNVVSDAAKRDELRARNDATFGGFVKAVIDAQVEIEVAKRMTKVQTTERVAAQKDARAEATTSPQLGTGRPSPNVASMTTDELIRVGLEEAQRDSR